MKHPFQYLTGNPKADKLFQKNGMILLEPPIAGDWVCSYQVDGESVAIVKTHTDSNSRVSRYLNRRKVEFIQDFFTFEA